MQDRPGNINLYLLYAEEDESLKNELERHLSSLQRQGYIDVWHDGKIDPGASVPEVQREYLHKAHVILLLISANFLAPDCYNKYEEELREAFERQKRGEVKIIPVILRDCLWQLDLLASLKPLPAGGHPIRSSHWENEDKAFKNIAVELQGIAQEFLSAKERLERKVNQVANDLIDYGRQQIRKAKASVKEAAPAGDEKRPEAVEERAESDKEQEAEILLQGLLDCLACYGTQADSSATAELIHHTLLQNGQLEEGFRKHNVEVACQRLHLYKQPFQVEEKKDTGRRSLGFLSNKEEGEEIKYTLGRLRPDGGMPGYVRIFFPASDAPPRISGLSL